MSVGQLVITEAGGVRVARLDLAVTKADPAGRGKIRGQRYICDLGRVASASCVACTLATQRAARVAEGATLESPLFPCAGGGFPSKEGSEHFALPSHPHRGEDHR